MSANTYAPNENSTGSNYNPSADSRVDNADYDASQDNARSGVTDDQSTERTELRGKVGKTEADELRANHFPGEGETTGTRGVKVDAYKSERAMDAALGNDDEEYQ